MTSFQKHIVIFGGTGFLGRYIVYALAKTGANIRIATRVPARAYFLKPAGNPGQIIPVACDIHDNASVANILQGATHVINLIGILAERGRKCTFQKVHVDTAERIAQMCREKKIKMLVHVSTLGAALDAPSRYGRTKAAGEDKVIHTFHNSVVLRPSLVFGSEDDFFNRFARLARLSPFLPLIGGGRTKFQPVYVGDIAEAVHNIIADGNPEKHFGQIYELGGPNIYTFRELMDIILKETGQSARKISLPTMVAKLVALLCAPLPFAPITVDQVRSLSRDSVLAAHTPGLADLGVDATTLEGILPSYMVRYKNAA